MKRYSCQTDEDFNSFMCAHPFIRVDSMFTEDVLVGTKIYVVTVIYYHEVEVDN